VGVSLGVVVVVFIGLVIASSRYSSAARTPAGIVRRLRRSGGRVTVSATGAIGPLGTWNPAGKGREMFFFRRGVGTHWLDDDGQVHLDWQSTNGHEEFVGPPLTELDPAGSNRTALWTVLIFGLVGLSGGFLFSLIGEVGPHPDRRVVFAIAGFAVALAVLVAIERWLVRRHTRTKPG